MAWHKIFAVSVVFATLVACKTDDVKGPDATGPSVSLSLGSQVISENGGTTDLTATLSASASEDVTVKLDLSGTAVEGTHYNISSTEIVITAGNITGSATISSIDDTAQNGNVSVLIDIASVTNASHDGLQGQTLIIEDDDVPPSVSLLINEVLYDPSNNGLDGDANGDGQYAQAEDEFIEFINLSSQPLDMSGFEIYDDEQLVAGVPNHTFPSGTVIQPGKCIVVFGGGLSWS